MLCCVCLERLARIGRETCGARCDATLRKRRSRKRRGVRSDRSLKHPIVMVAHPCACGCGSLVLVAPRRTQGEEAHYLDAEHKAYARKCREFERQEAGVPEAPGVRFRWGRHRPAGTAEKPAPK